MAEVCPRCLMTFPHHLVVRARCAKRWRGANFDAAAAEGNVGAAVARELGMRVRTNPELEAFYRKAFVKAYADRRGADAASDALSAYGTGIPPSPIEGIDTSAGETFEFHVGLREPVAAEQLARIEAAAREAVAGSRHFTLA